MTTENPRIQVTLDTQTSALLSSMAISQSRSLSATAADLIRESLELHEDEVLSELADRRLKETKKWVSHEKAWL